MEPRLPALVERLAGEGVDAVSVVPVFLGQGGHVLRDLPALVGDARAQHPAMRIVLAEAVGENQAVLQAIATYCANSSDL